MLATCLGISRDLFAVSVVGCLLGYSSCLVVWIPLFLDPSDGVFGRFDLAALCGCRTLNFCLFVCSLGWCAGRLGWYICGGLTGHPAWLVLWIVFDLDTPISLLLVLCLLVLLFAVSVVGCLLGYSSCLVVWIPLFLDPSDGAFGRFDLAALCGCRTLNFCLFFESGVFAIARPQPESGKMHVGSAASPVILALNWKM